MPVLEAEDRPFSEVDHFGLAIQRVGRNGLHTGVLYRLADEDPRILHLAFHHDLQDGPAEAPFRWAQLGVDEVNKIFLAELAARVASRNPAIAYAFNSDGIAIDAESGEVQAGPPGRGLTCATFVSALLRAHAFEVVDLSTWPNRAEDTLFHHIIVTNLQQQGYQEQAEAVQQDTEWRRLRPDELVGAGQLSDDQWPVEYTPARHAADLVQSELSGI